MAKLSKKAGTTSQTINIFISDSASTTDDGKTGLVYNSAGLVAYYCRPKAAATAVILVTQTTTGAWLSGGFVEIDATNMPGWYRFDIPDAALATGVDSVAIHLEGASDMAPLPLEIELTGWDNSDGVNGGMAGVVAAKDEIIARGDFAWVTASGYAVQGDSMSLDDTERAAVAEVILAMDIATVPSIADRSLANSIRFSCNRKYIEVIDSTSGVLHVRNEDDTADAWTAAVTFNRMLLPTIAVDPI